MDWSNDRVREFFSHYDPKTLREFKVYHAENPHVYEEFKALAFEIRRTGRTKYSSKTIICVLRYRQDLRTTGNEFKINDKFQSIYGRLLAYYHPEFEDFFEFRVRENAYTKRQKEEECVF